MHKNHRNPRDKPRRDTKRLYHCNGARAYWANYQNRRRRYRERRLIHHEKYEEIRKLPEPIDTWLWD